MPAGIIPSLIAQVILLAGKLRILNVFCGFVNGSLLLLIFWVPLNVSSLPDDCQHKIYSIVRFIFFESAGGVADLNQFHCPTKFLGKNISSPKSRSAPTSFSQ